MLAATRSPRPSLSWAGVRPTVVLVGMSGEREEELVRRIGTRVETVSAASAEEALEILGRPGAGEVATVITGEALDGEPARRLVAEAVASGPTGKPLFLVLSGGGDLALFQDLIDRDHLFFLSQKPPPDEDLAAVVWSAVHRWSLARYRSREAHRPDPMDAEEASRVRAHEIAELARRVALQEDAEEAEDLIAESLREMLGADRAYALFYDPREDLLWARHPGSPGERRESAAVGLVSFAVRTGRTVRAAPVGADPRWEREADDPAGDGDQGFLAVPVRTAERRVLGVLVAVRDGTEGSAFRDDEAQLLTRLAEQVAPAFERFALERRAEDAGVAEEGLGAASSLYRRRAIEEHVAGAGERGDPLRLSPAWTRWTYRSLVGVLVVSSALAAFVRVPEYARGPAVVRSGGVQTVPAVAPGTVTAVAVSPGQRVEAGDLLVRFHGARELAELERIDREIELQLLDRLRDPSDPATGRALVGLRAQRELAEALLEERRLTAPRGGVIGDVRVRVGQRVAAGDAVVSLSMDRAETSLVAFLPGRYRPLLAPGLPLRLELTGFPGRYQELTVGGVGQEVVGPAEAARYLGPELADAVTLSGPVAVVEARLPAETFELDGRSYAFHDGTPATVEVRVRTEPALLTLFPHLRGFFGLDGG